MEDVGELKISDKHYPAALRELSDAPEALYYRGNISITNSQMVAVVGTRHPSDYGKQAASQIAGELAGAGLVVISGLAPGIDTFAHAICVEKKLPTVAVLGTGLDEKSLYPQSNLALSRKIIETGGCLISEFKPGTPGFPNNFRQRNRIVSALSSGVLVIEAKEKSGSLITARFARGQNKKLFALPGPVYSLNSAGPNKLIKEGAQLIESAKDILDVLGITPSEAARAPLQKAETPAESAIFAALKEEALYIDVIIKKSKLSPAEVATLLALMEISGKIRNLGGNVYSLNS